MPSMLHEVLVDLIRNAPELLIPLLCGQLGAVDLRGARFETDERNYSQLPDLDADLVLQVQDLTGQLVCALIPEIQLSVDYEKERAWPAYQAGTHRRLNCPTFVVVIAVDPAVARWAAGPFSTGQTHFRPLVIGPKHLPIIVDPGHARDNVELAVLCGLAHCNEPEVEQIGEALWHALDQRSERRPEGQSDRRHDLYWDLFLAAINEATRRHLMIRLGSYQPQSEWGKQLYAEGESKGRLEGLVEGERKGRLEGRREGERKGRLEGRREGQAAALTALLQARGLAPGPGVRERIEQCRNLKTLRQWLRRAVTADHLDEVFES